MSKGGGDDDDDDDGGGNGDGDGGWRRSRDEGWRGGTLARREGDIKGEDEGYQSPEKPRGLSLSADCI